METHREDDDYADTPLSMLVKLPTCLYDDNSEFRAAGNLIIPLSRSLVCAEFEVGYNIFAPLARVCFTSSVISSLTQKTQNFPSLTISQSILSHSRCSNC